VERLNAGANNRRLTMRRQFAMQALMQARGKTSSKIESLIADAGAEDENGRLTEQSNAAAAERRRERTGRCARQANCRL